MLAFERFATKIDIVSCGRDARRSTDRSRSCAALRSRPAGGRGSAAKLPIFPQPSRIQCAPPMTAWRQIRRFLWPRLSGGWGLGQGTFARSPGNERDAPIPAGRVGTTDWLKSTQSGPSWPDRQPTSVARERPFGTPQRMWQLRTAGGPNLPATPLIGFRPRRRVKLMPSPATEGERGRREH